ncbi:PREDICTED: beta-amyrin 11-oxidase-like [Nicotiana attenuata]|uniref:beta-amyrin 11-oxidase-like n=1 Tax=Nicotiana attenuata TaxID=49451 RepID=UPI0009047215|nr:PREDICTED: beta-amyrin 11-oxidase-like [Nicotiana attenuata]
MYKGLILGKPSIIVIKPEICRKILLDDENFERHMPKTSLNVLGQEPPSNQEDKKRRMRSNLIQSHGGSLFFQLDINETVKNSFEKWASTEKPIEFLAEMKKTTFEVLMRILIGDEVAQDLLDVVFKENTFLIRGFLGIPINIPGFDYNRANKARGAIVKIFYQILEERKAMIGKNKATPKSSIVDTTLDSSQDDENIITTLVSVTFAGYEFTAEVAAKAIMYLEKHPDFLQKAKVPHEPNL